MTAWANRSEDRSGFAGLRKRKQVNPSSMIAYQSAVPKHSRRRPRPQHDDGDVDMPSPHEFHLSSTNGVHPAHFFKEKRLKSRLDSLPSRNRERPLLRLNQDLSGPVISHRRKTTRKSRTKAPNCRLEMFKTDSSYKPYRELLKRALSGSPVRQNGDTFAGWKQEATVQLEMDDGLTQQLNSVRMRNYAQDGPLSRGIPDIYSDMLTQSKSNSTITSGMEGLHLMSRRRSTLDVLNQVQEEKRREEEERRAVAIREEERKRKEFERRRRLAEEEELRRMQEEEASGFDFRTLKCSPLTAKENQRIRVALSQEPRTPLAQHAVTMVSITQHDLHTLHKRSWLNDEVMNFYMRVLQDRSNFCCEHDSVPEKYRIKCLFMNSFFHSKLSNNRNGYNYKGVSRWTRVPKLKKYGVSAGTIFELDKMIFPVHVGEIHWCCGVINVRDKQLEYYDSMGGTNPHFFTCMRQYIEDEHMNKKKTALDASHWKEYAPGRGVPQQRNGYDCGVFTLSFADCVSMDYELDFSQEDMDVIRNRLMIEILDVRTCDMSFLENGE